MAAALYATGSEFGDHQQGRGQVETAHPKEEAGTKVQVNRTAAGVEAALELLGNDGDAQPRRQGQAQHPGGAAFQIRNLQGARFEPQALETIGAQGRGVRRRVFRTRSGGNAMLLQVVGE
jgi:hypothetical protein